MPWVRFEDDYPWHRKVRRLSDAAYRTNSEAIHWCAKNRTDGQVPRDELDDVTNVKQPLKHAAAETFALSSPNIRTNSYPNRQRTTGRTSREVRQTFAHPVPSRPDPTREVLPRLPALPPVPYRASPKPGEGTNTTPTRRSRRS
jgi:hypothetical protein